MKETLPEISHEINIVTLTSDEEKQKTYLLWGYEKNPKDSESLAIDILTFLCDFLSVMGNASPILRKAIR